MKSFAPAIYLDVNLPRGGVFTLPPLAAELALYSIDNAITVDGELVAAHTLTLLQPGQPSSVSAPEGARLMVVGGDALDGKRLMWWNFVSSRKERIAQASEDWAAQRMGQVPGEIEFIPLPERKS